MRIEPNASINCGRFEERLSDCRRNEISQKHGIALNIIGITGISAGMQNYVGIYGIVCRL